LPPEERPETGKKANLLKGVILRLLDEREKQLKTQDRACAVNFDFSLPGKTVQTGTTHPITQTIEEIASIFTRMGFVTVEGKHVKLPQVGTVVIGDDVEIGSNVTIDRARFDKTVIGKGTKIDNLVQIAHNVIIGKHCIIISQVGISGSTKIGDGAILAGQAGIHGHLTVGAGVMVASKTGVTKSIPAHTKVSGFPAQPYMKEQRLQAVLRQVPVHIKTIQKLKKRIDQLEKRLNHG